jgi:predicted CxxxxCH...CXXCH cytochrome family protein
VLSRWFLVVSLVTFGCDVGVYTGEGDGDGNGPIDGRYHPTNFADPVVHGPELNLQTQPCRGCHGDDLAGTVMAPSCDSCHTPKEPQTWRSDCLFCHGGGETDTGAPPRDLDGSSADISFPAHTRHLTTAIMTSIGCADCHSAPAGVLDAGHVFDESPGAAEVVFVAGRSADGSYSTGSCSNLYCHGDGRNNGAVTTTAPMTCSGCHGTPPNSGEHGEHDGERCADCHLDTTADDATIANAAIHIDGAVQNRFIEAVTITKNGGQITCSGPCHGRNHENDRW